MSFGGGDEHGDEYGHADPSRQGTRTRLPESEGGARPPVVRPGKSLVAIVGVVVLLIAAIAFATRGDDGDGGGDGDGNQAQPTAPTGEKPVQGGGGDIPSGFAQTEQGAQSAAANYAVALVSAEIIKPGDRPQIVNDIFAPDKGAEMQDKMDKSYSAGFLDKLGLDEDGNAPTGSTYVSRTVPVGTKVVDFTPNSADLEVWCTGVYGMAGEDSTAPVTTDWFTMKLKLQWTDGDWKVQSFAQEKGPAPVNGDLRASNADEITEAVEGYGGFTYAR